MTLIYYMLVSIFVLCIISLIYLTIVESNRKKSFLKGKASISFNSIIKAVPILGEIQKKVAVKYAITNTSDREYNENAASFIMFLFLIASSASFYMLLSYAKVWYIFIVNLAICFAIPYLIFNIYFDIMLSRLIKQLPDAIDEFSSSYRKSNKIYHALRDSYPSMPKMMSKEFERLYKSYNIDFEEGIVFFKERVKNEWAYIFTSLLLINHQKGGNITEQLDDLNGEIENDIITKDKTRSKMMGFKVISLGGVLLTFFAIKANEIMSPAAREYYNTVEGMNAIAITITVSAVTFLISSIIEKV